jgi:acyl carrier protein
MHTKEDILAVIRKHLSSAVDGVAPDKIDATLSMKEFGANSLDIVEVVSATMRELRVKVPRAELNGIVNIQGLVDALHEAALQKQAL